MNRCRRAPRLRAAERAFSLVEILIVIAIIALLATGVSLAAFHAWIGAQKKTTGTDASKIRQAVKTWWLSHEPSFCPSFGQLVADREIDREARSGDAWGTPWRITCADEDAEVRSAGPDKHFDTDDDIRAP
jgi:prepilin-type N-terminal cleavage/methylation domain-containing protein